MGIKNEILIVIAIVVLGGGYFLFITPDDKVQDISVTNSVTADVQEYFNEKLQEAVIKRVGQPIHGFVPFMFLEAFSGIVPQDFDGADALLGEYKIVEKKLVFIMDEGGPIHSAAEALSEDGMQTVLANIQKRANVLLTTTDEINGLLLFLGAPAGVVVKKCLPEQRNVDACIEIYQPVCASVKVQCFTEPCNLVEETFANSCKACASQLVDTYVEGECGDSGILPFKSGVIGKVLLGPICPGPEYDPPFPNCADKPYATEIQVIAEGGLPFATIVTDKEGNYRVMLPPGAYSLEAVGGEFLPRCAAKSIIVESDTILETDLSCDTGIR